MNLKDKIKAHVSIQDVCEQIGVHLEKGGGGELRALCPLHDEDTPSFYVNTEKGFYHCFGCGSGGDAITLVEQTQGLSFNEALVTIAEWFGIEYEEDEINTRKSIIKAANQIFEENREDAYKYAEARGISKATAKAFGLGYAKRGYADKLISSGYTVEEMQAVGLLSDTGRELFEGYVTIPLYNTAGILVGISGRATGEQLPKYMTTRRSQVFDKRRFIFGTNLAKEEAKKSRTVYVAEGQFDVMAMHEAGITNSVAILGSSATIQHMLALVRMGVKRIVAITDSDAAGIKAAQALFHSAKTLGLNPYAVLMEEGFDPNAVLLTHGKKYLAELVENSTVSHGAFLVWLAQRNAQAEGTTPEMELANLLMGINRYDPAYDDAIQQAEKILNINVKEFKRFLSTRISTAERRKAEYERKREQNEAIARALLKCPTTKAVAMLKEVYDSRTIQGIANTMPIEEGEACEEIIKIYHELKRRALAHRLEELKQLAMKGDKDATMEMVRVNAELQALKGTGI